MLKKKLKYLFYCRGFHCHLCPSLFSSLFSLSSPSYFILRFYIFISIVFISFIFIFLLKLPVYLFVFVLKQHLCLIRKNFSNYFSGWGCLLEWVLLFFPIRFFSIKVLVFDLIAIGLAQEITLLSITNLFITLLFVLLKC